MSNERIEHFTTVILSCFAGITGWIGLNLTNVDLIEAIILKFLSIIATVLVIIINWDGALTKIKKFFNGR